MAHHGDARHIDAILPETNRFTSHNFNMDKHSDRHYHYIRNRPAQWLSLVAGMLPAVLCRIVEKPTNHRQGHNQQLPIINMSDTKAGFLMTGQLHPSQDKTCCLYCSKQQRYAFTAKCPAHQPSNCRITTRRTAEQQFGPPRLSRINITWLW